MIFDRKIDLEAYTSSAKNDYGDEIKVWADYATQIDANTQPSNKQASLQEKWGNKDGTFYITFINPRVVSEQDRVIDPQYGTLRVLEVHLWNNHTEIISVKVTE